MPTYDYACKGCGHRFERFESINDGGTKECLKCGKKKARRMLGMGAGLIFKGSGFYTTDSKSSPKGEGGAGKDEKKSESKAENKAETKAEKKEPAKETKKEEKEHKK